MIDFKNIVLIYKGGGYDGCIWEWNTVLWDQDGAYHPLHVTGCAGINDEADAKDAVEHLVKLDGAVPGWDDRWTHLPSGVRFDLEQAGLFDLTQNFEKPGREGAAWSSWEDAMTTYNHGYMMQIAQAAEKQQIETIVPVQFRCDFCHEWRAGEQAVFDGGMARGDGGIGLVWDEAMCQSCFDGASCSSCGDFDVRRLEQHPDTMPDEEEWALDSEEHECRHCRADEDDEDGPPGDENPLPEMEHNLDYPDVTEPGGEA